MVGLACNQSHFAGLEITTTVVIRIGVKHVITRSMPRDATESSLEDEVATWVLLEETW